MTEAETQIIALLTRIGQDMKVTRELVTTAVHAMREAEAEVSEKMRRFIMYAHDLHDVCYMYESRGHQAPDHVKAEMERCDDRYRQLLDEAHGPGGTFEKVRREMAKDPLNKWDHTRLLNKPKAQP